MMMKFSTLAVAGMLCQGVLSEPAEPTDIECKFGRNPKATAGMFTARFSRRGGRVAIWSTEAGRKEGFVAVRQKRIQEIDHTDPLNPKVVANWNMNGDHTWTPFGDDENTDLDVGKWVTSFDAVDPDSNRQFGLDATIVEATTTQRSLCFVDPRCAPPTLEELELPRPCYNTISGECSNVEGRRSSCPAGEGWEKCEVYTDVVARSAQINIRVFGWEFRPDSPTNTLRYEVEINSKLGGREARKARKKRRRAGLEREVEAIELDHGEIDFFTDVVITGLEEQRLVPVEVENEKDDTQSWVVVHLPQFAMGEELSYTAVIVPSEDMSPSSFVAPALTLAGAAVVAALL